MACYELLVHAEARASQELLRARADNPAAALLLALAADAAPSLGERVHARTRQAPAALAGAQHGAGAPGPMAASAAPEAVHAGSAGPTGEHEPAGATCPLLPAHLRMRFFRCDILCGHVPLQVQCGHKRRLPPWRSSRTLQQARRMLLVLVAGGMQLLLPLMLLRAAEATWLLLMGEEPPRTYLHQFLPRRSSSSLRL